MKNIKNLAATALVAVALISPALSFASTTPIGNGNPYTVANVWGLTGEQSQKYWVAPGTVLSLKNGAQSVCPWFIAQGCYDLRWYYGS